MENDFVLRDFLRTFLDSTGIEGGEKRIQVEESSGICKVVVRCRICDTVVCR